MTTPKCVFQGNFSKNPSKSHDNLTFGGGFLPISFKSSILMTFFVGGVLEWSLLNVFFKALFWQPPRSHETLTYGVSASKCSILVTFGGVSKMTTPKCVFQGGFLKPSHKIHENLTFGGGFLTTTCKSSILMTFGGVLKRPPLNIFFKWCFDNPPKSHENLIFGDNFWNPPKKFMRIELL